MGLLPLINIPHCENNNCLTHGGPEWELVEKSWGAQVCSCAIDTDMPCRMHVTTLSRHRPTDCMCTCSTCVMHVLPQRIIFQHQSEHTGAWAHVCTQPSKGASFVLGVRETKTKRTLSLPLCLQGVDIFVGGGIVLRKQNVHMKGHMLHRKDVS